jgi:SAM-dependent methyltransferase
VNAGVNASSWIERFGQSVGTDAPVLDVACGDGRHTRWFAARGHEVLAVDRDLGGVDDLRGSPRVRLLQFDLERGDRVPLAAGTFGAVVVTNYLWRPILDDFVALLAPGGWLLYETFALGNERYGRPTNLDFLLRPGELLELAARHGLHVVAYEDVVVDEPRPACVQRLAANVPGPAPTA